MTSLLGERNWKLEIGNWMTEKWKWADRLRVQLPSTSVTFPGKSRTEISVQQSPHALGQFVQTFPFGGFQVALVNAGRQMVPCFIERTPGLSAELSILLVTEPSEALRKVGCHGRGGPPKLARQSKFLEIWK